MTDEIQIKNPLLSRVRIPGEHRALPSKGLFYTNNELTPEVRDGEILILPINLQCEIYLRSPDMLYDGSAITKVFEICCPQVLKPTELLSKDVDFILTILRKISYGNQLEITYNHNCKPDSKEYNYPVSIDQLLKQIKQIDPTTITGKFTVQLENDQRVHFSPIRYKDVITMLQVNLIEQDKELPPTEILIRTTTYIASLIDNVDGTTDKRQIEEWLAVIPPKWTKAFQQAIDDSQNNWGVDFNVAIECKDCNEMTKVATPLSPLFFFM